jgi:hypothetical protein
MSDDNPVVRYGLDPRSTLAELTERLRELAEEADEPERAALRAAWQSLAQSPARRFVLALDAGPFAPPIARPPPLAPRASPAFEPTLADLLAPAALAPRLGPEDDAEREARAPDLSWAVRPAEVEVTGALPRAKVRERGGRR